MSGERTVSIRERFLATGGLLDLEADLALHVGQVYLERPQLRVTACRIPASSSTTMTRKVSIVSLSHRIT